MISSDRADAIIDGPRVKGVALTGPAAAGRKFAARAGQNPKPPSPDPGGSDAFIVLEDADLDHVLHGAISGRMSDDGQPGRPASAFWPRGAVFQGRERGGGDCHGQ